jgi:N-sulfoglucosamine sulfohydrolase
MSKTRPLYSGSYGSSTHCKTGLDKKNRTAVQFFLFLLLVLCHFSSAYSSQKNIILFVTDDQSLDLGCYGNKVIKTPNMDSLAKDGVLFHNAFCTTASCSASRSVILTGLQNHANGHYGHSHSYNKFSSHPWVKTVPVLLSDLGYRTARIGKHHNLPEEVYHFEQKLPGSSRSPYEMANHCEKLIHSKSDKPFFLFFATSDPHRSRRDKEGSEFRPDRFGNRDGKPYPGIKPVIYNPKDVIVPRYLPDTPVCRTELAQYYQSVSRIDQGLGRLIQILKESGEWDNTVFIFTADHGIAFPGGKTTVYDPGLRVPFIVRDPSMEKRGTENNAMISFVDLTPTILDFAGGLNPKTGKLKKPIYRNVRRKKIEYTFQGRSFRSIIKEENPTGWDQIFASHTFHEITMYYPMRVVRDRKFKLIWNIAHQLPYPFASDLWAAPSWQAQYLKGPDTKYGQRTVHQYIHRPRFELYDIVNDPDEVNNLADHPKYHDILVDYQVKLRNFQAKTDDPWILKWDYE